MLFWHTRYCLTSLVLYRSAPPIVIITARYFWCYSSTLVHQPYARLICAAANGFCCCCWRSFWRRGRRDVRCFWPEKNSWVICLHGIYVWQPYRIVCYFFILCDFWWCADVSLVYNRTYALYAVQGGGDVVREVPTVRTARREQGDGTCLRIQEGWKKWKKKTKKKKGKKTTKMNKKTEEKKKKKWARYQCQVRGL